MATWPRNTTVSPDGLTFTFKLRKDAKFDSGNPVTANDAAFSLQRVVKLNKTPGFIITQFGFNRRQRREDDPRAGRLLRWR